MKLCYIIPQVSVPVSGGVSIQAHFTALYLKKLGVEIVYYNPWEKYDWKTFDLVHIFRTDQETHNIACWLSENNIPSVVSPVFYNPRSLGYIRLYMNLSLLIKRFVSGYTTDLLCLKDICKRSRHVFPNTGAEARFIEAIGIASQKITVVPNGVEERFALADPDPFIQKYGIKDFILTVGYFGYKRKNLAALISALQHIEHPAVIIGKIPGNATGLLCQEQIRKIKHITWIDSLEHNDPLLASAYAACKVFVLPSYLETPGLAALEAGLAGASIVITPYGGTKEYFREFAEYVNPYSVSSIKECLLKALSQNRNESLKHHILENYTWPVVAQKTVDAYRKVKI